MNANEARNIAMNKKKQDAEEAERKRIAAEIAIKERCQSQLNHFKKSIPNKIAQEAEHGYNYTSIELATEDRNCIEPLMEWLKSDGFTSSYEYRPYEHGFGSDGYSIEAHYVLRIGW